MSEATGSGESGAVTTLGSTILCRPALPSDRDAVMAFLQHIWGSEDYVTDEWDEWMQNARGLLAVAVIEGRPVGLSHLADLGHGEYWLEGLRVDPKFRGQHVGSHLHDYFVSVWERGSGRALRLASMESRAEDVHHLARRTGFEQVASVTGYQAEPLSGDPALSPLGEEDLKMSLQALQAGPVQAALVGLMDLGWQFAAASEDRLRTLYDAGMLFQWRDGSGVAAISLSDRRGGTDVYLHAAGSTHEDLPLLLQDVRRWAALHNADHVFWLMPSEPAIQEVANAAGFWTEWQEALLLFQRRR